jgi:TonB family protein
MVREEQLMQALRALAGFALGSTMLTTAALDRPAAIAALGPVMTAAFADPAAAGRAEVAVSFDADGRIASSALVRSSGSRRSDATAREAALQLASLQPSAGAAGRTLVFRIAPP